MGRTCKALIWNQHNSFLSQTFSSLGFAGTWSTFLTSSKILSISRLSSSCLCSQSWVTKSEDADRNAWRIRSIFTLTGNCSMKTKIWTSEILTSCRRLYNVSLKIQNTLSLANAWKWKITIKWHQWYFYCVLYKNIGCTYFVCNYIKNTFYKILALLLFKYLLISLQMRRHLQKVMPEHWVIWDFTKTEHGRLREVDHESRKKKKRERF